MTYEEYKTRLLNELKDIAPQWANLLINKQDNENLVYPADSKCAMNNLTYCIVGEAHKFTQNYTCFSPTYCADCDRAASDLIGLAHKIDMDDVPETWGKLEIFINHFKERHKK